MGQFYVTPVVFALKMLICKDTGKSPIYLGPLLIHQSMKFTNYLYFASQLVGRYKDTKAVGTDGEGPLYQDLVDATSEKDFREKLCTLKERWARK